MPCGALDSEQIDAARAHVGLRDGLVRDRFPGVAQFTQAAVQIVQCIELALGAGTTGEGERLLQAGGVAVDCFEALQMTFGRAERLRDDVFELQ